MNSEAQITSGTLSSMVLQPPPLPGVRPSLLCQQILNTAPFLLEFPSEFIQSSPAFAIFRNALNESQIKDIRNYSLTQYYQLCMSAHWLTVATFVPTDVDLAIRSKLWLTASHELIEELSQIVMDCLSWDSRPFSTRWIEASHSTLSGHHGEWFSVAAASYANLRKIKNPLASQMQELISEEVKRELHIFKEVLDFENPLSTLKASCILAHNFGDLDRVLEHWHVPETDPLCKEVLKLGQEAPHPRSRHGGLAGFAGWLNKNRMAVENHRHFALRAPRCLRKSADFLLPIGPFFDEWGRTLVRHPLLTAENLGEVTSALIEGWERFDKTEVTPVGYARALCGILEHFPGGMNELSKHLPSSAARALRSGPLRSLCSVSRERFENQWIQFAFQAKKKFKTGDF